MAYNEIANMIHPGGREQGPVQPLWDPHGKAFYFTYGYHGDNRAGYDDRPSIDLKLQLMTELDLAGVMWWRKPYVASKRRRCPAVVQYPHFLPDTPVGNVVMKRCHAASHCPESWQAFICGPEGWGVGSSCYDKAVSSPALYFYGELKLIRTGTRDRNVPNSSKELPRASYMLSTQVGSKRPQYISQYIKFIKMRKLIVEIDTKRTKSSNKPRLILKSKKKGGSRKM
ncbi:hypothetical protein BGZ76_001171, partial [Entomortierella beljakovae]